MNYVVNQLKRGSSCYFYLYEAYSIGKMLEILAILTQYYMHLLTSRLISEQVPLMYN